MSPRMPSAAPIPAAMQGPLAAYRALVREGAIDVPANDVVLIARIAV